MKRSPIEPPSTDSSGTGLRPLSAAVIVAAAVLLCGSPVLVCQDSPGADATQELQFPEEVIFSSNAGDVVFPHKLHLNDMEIPCEDCHHETLAAQLSMPHPEYFEDFWISCATCHKDGEVASSPQPCSTCHHNSPVDIADETLGSKAVIHQSCWQCHPIGTGPAASESCGFCHASEDAGGEG